MPSSDMHSPTKPQHHRRHGHRKKWQVLGLVLFVALLLAVVVGMLLLLNSNIFTEVR